MKEPSLSTIKNRDKEIQDGKSEEFERYQNKLQMDFFRSLYQL